MEDPRNERIDGRQPYSQIAVEGLSNATQEEKAGGEAVGEPRQYLAFIVELETRHRVSDRLQMTLHFSFG
jgi:hypothetical protein